jgi:hypothetical protein
VSCTLTLLLLVTEVHTQLYSIICTFYPLVMSRVDFVHHLLVFVVTSLFLNTSRYLRLVYHMLSLLNFHVVDVLRLLWRR